MLFSIKKKLPLKYNTKVELYDKKNNYEKVLLPNVSIGSFHALYCCKRI